MKTHHTIACASTIVLALVWALDATRADAQGCEPIRFIAPVQLGGQGDAYQRAYQWQLTLAYRRLASKEWFVGTGENSALAPGGQSPVFKIHTLVADVAYAISDRWRLSASLPISKGSVAHLWADKAMHEQRATGIGDLSVMAEGWVLEPRAHERGNIAVGVGMKAPTGSHTIPSQFYLASSTITFPADQTIQPGDGGWALLLQSRAFRQLNERTHVYAFGSYMVSPKAKSDVQWQPNSGVYWSVPDVYSARLGTAFSVLPDRDLSVSLGGRIDGIPVHDLFGGGDDITIKRTSYVIFADPGLSMTMGKGTMTVSLPYRLRVNRMKSVFERNTGALNAGGFAKYLVFAAYSYPL